jgi:hypothetical protein
MARGSTTAHNSRRQNLSESSINGDRSRASRPGFRERFLIDSTPLKASDPLGQNSGSAVQLMVGPSVRFMLKSRKHRPRKFRYRRTFWFVAGLGNGVNRRRSDRRRLMLKVGQLVVVEKHFRCLRECHSLVGDWAINSRTRCFDWSFSGRLIGRGNPGGFVPSRRPTERQREPSRMPRERHPLAAGRIFVRGHRKGRVSLVEPGPKVLIAQCFLKSGLVGVYVTHIDN